MNEFESVDLSPALSQSSALALAAASALAFSAASTMTGFAGLVGVLFVFLGGIFVSNLVVRRWVF